MSYRVTLLNATGALSPVADYLYEHLNSLSLQLADHFELTNIDVTISPFGHGDAPLLLKPLPSRSLARHSAHGYKNRH